MLSNSWVHSLTWQEQNFGTIPGNNSQIACINEPTYQLKSCKLDQNIIHVGIVEQAPNVLVEGNTNTQTYS